jgi:hypothetical protein
VGGCWRAGGWVLTSRVEPSSRGLLCLCTLHFCKKPLPQYAATFHLSHLFHTLFPARCPPAALSWRQRTTATCTSQWPSATAGARI